MMVGARVIARTGWVVAIDWDGRLGVWNDQGRRITHADDAHVQRTFAVSSDGGTAVTLGPNPSSPSGRCRTEDLARSPELESCSRHLDNLVGLALAPDGARAVTLGLDGKVVLWSATTGQTIAELRGHLGPPRSARFSTDGRSVLTVGDDRTVRLWDVATGLPLATLTGFEEDPLDAAFSTDGAEVLTGSTDRTPRIFPATLDGFWRLACQLTRHAGDDARVRAACAMIPL